MVGPEAPKTMTATVTMAAPAATPTMSDPPISGDPPPPLNLNALVIMVVAVNADEGTLLFQSLTLPARSADLIPTTSLTPPVYTLPIISSHVLVSDQ